MLLASAMAFQACKPKPGELAVSPPPVAGPTREQLVALHNDRVARLATTYSSGVIEIRWTDRKGRHFEQGDLDFWHTTGERTALRISKLGEPLLWVGSNSDEYWLFDLLSKDDRVLYRGRHEDAIVRMGAFGVRPLALLDLLGLTPIDAAASRLQTPVWDNAHKAWIIESRGRGGPMRLFFDQSSLLPVRVESLDASGRLVAYSTLARHESVYVPDTAVMAQPKMAELIDIRRGESSGGEMADDEIAGEVKIAMNETTGKVDEKQLARVMDLEGLIKSMRPDRVGEVAAAE
jgi:hypothetical protein